MRLRFQRALGDPIPDPIHKGSFTIRSTAHNPGSVEPFTRRRRGPKVADRARATSTQGGLWPSALPLDPRRSHVTEIKAPSHEPVAAKTT